jgi:hypothetical protein
MAAPTIIDRARGTRGQYQSLADKIVSAWLPLARSPDVGGRTKTSTK